MSRVGTTAPHSQCWYFQDCPPKTTPTNWVLHDTGLTVMTYVVIAMCVVALIYVVVRLWKYFHRPYCADCLFLTHPKQVRTKYTYSVDGYTVVPICEEHLFECIWNDEPELTCNLCGETCKKEWFEKYHLIHRCPKCGTVIAPSGRFTTIVKQLRGKSSGFPRSTLAVSAAGVAAGSSSSSGGSGC